MTMDRSEPIVKVVTAGHVLWKMFIQFSLDIFYCSSSRVFCTKSIVAGMYSRRACKLWSCGRVDKSG